MRIRVVALSQRVPAWIASGAEEYASRLPREWAFETIVLRPEPRDRGRTVSQMLTAEAARIATACAGRRVVALDERGAPWTTQELASHIARWRETGDDLAFVIGSADGLAPSVKSRAIAVVALSPMTLPHGLVRVLLAEQLYRAHCLSTGHPYHRD